MLQQGRRVNSPDANKIRRLITGRLIRNYKYSLQRRLLNKLTEAWEQERGLQLYEVEEIIKEAFKSKRKKTRA